jgi:hypothetical protein
MSADRYTKIILTVIAIELGWLGVKDAAVPVMAQAQPAEPIPVIIKGVEGVRGKPLVIPVRLAEATTPVRVTVDRPLPIEAPLPIRVDAISPFVVTTHPERPLLVQSVQAVPAPRPGL